MGLEQFTPPPFGLGWYLQPPSLPCPAQAKEKKATLLQLVELWRKEPGPLGKEAKALSRDDNEVRD